MSFSGKMYVKLADELIACSKKPSLEEAYFRSSVSRSYYGVFLAARTLMESRGTSTPKSGQAHTFVRNYYLNSNNRIERKIGNTLKNLWRERKNADYETSHTFDEVRAADAYEEAVKAMNRLISRGL